MTNTDDQSAEDNESREPTWSEWYVCCTSCTGATLTMVRVADALCGDVEWRAEWGSVSEALP